LWRCERSARVKRRVADGEPRENWGKARERVEIDAGRR